MYSHRYIELDGDKHGALGMPMLAKLCGIDTACRCEAWESALTALQARIQP